jgi:hypothetical protein
MWVEKETQQKKRKREMECISWCINEQDIWVCLITLFERAQKSIHLAVPTFNWKTLLGLPGQKELFSNIVKQTTQRGVQIHILAGETLLRSREERPPSNCFVRYVARFGSKIKDECIFWHWDDLISEQLEDGTTIAMGEKRVFWFNQSYLMMDETLALVGPIDLSMKPDVLGSFSDTKVNYSPVCAVVKPDEKFIKVVMSNWNSNGLKSIPMMDRFFFDSKQNALATRPINATNPQHNQMIKLIQEAKESIFIQSEYFVSNGTTENKIAEALIRRMVKAYQTKDDPFCFIVLTNSQSPQHFHQMYHTTLLCLSTDYMMELLQRLGVPDPYELHTRILVASVQTAKAITYFQGTLLIQDSRVALVSSAAIYDHSLAPHCCAEFGVIIKEKKYNQLVAHLEHQLLQEHLNLVTHEGKQTSLLPFRQYLEMGNKYQGSVKPYRQPSDIPLGLCRMVNTVKKKTLGNLF